MCFNYYFHMCLGSPPWQEGHREAKLLIVAPGLSKKRMWKNKVCLIPLKVTKRAEHFLLAFSSWTPHHLLMAPCRKLILGLIRYLLWTLKKRNLAYLMIKFWLFLYSFILCVWLLCLHGCMWYTQMPGEYAHFPGTGLLVVVGFSRTCWKLNPSLLQEQQILVTAEPFLPLCYG